MRGNKVDLKASFIRLLKDFAAAFMPYSCHRCRVSTDFGIVFCADCHAKLVSALHPPRETDDTRCDFPVYTLSSYSSVMADVIRIIKYHPSVRLLKVLAEACQKHGDIRSLVKKGDVIVPVPMHSQRFSKRGFNQAAELAADFAASAGCHLSPALIRTRATRPQADCDEEERRDNLKDAFALDSNLKRSAFANSHIILVDDVATTGSTLQLCANKLRELRPAKISALVVSHSYKKILTAD